MRNTINATATINNSADLKDRTIVACGIDALRHHPVRARLYASRALGVSAVELLGGSIFGDGAALKPQSQGAFLAKGTYAVPSSLVQGSSCSPGMQRCWCWERPNVSPFSRFIG